MLQHFGFASKLFSLVMLGAIAGQQAAQGQSISVGDGPYIYQIQFTSYTNPEGKTYSGAKCDVTGGKCDAQFTGYVEVFGTLDTRSTALTWPGSKKEEKKWPIIGKKSYTEKSLKNFAYVNLTGAEFAGFKSAILRVKVTDLDVLQNDEINSYIVALPGLRSLTPARYEMDSKFGRPFSMQPLSLVQPEARGKKSPKVNQNANQQIRLSVSVRAWGMPKKTIQLDMMKQVFRKNPERRFKSVRFDGGGDASRK